MSILILAIILRSLAILLFIFGVLPRMFREAFVRDYLRVLRILIPLMTIIYLCIGILALYVSFCRVNACINDAITNNFGLFNAFASLAIAIVMLLIYHRKY